MTAEDKKFIRGEIDRLAQITKRGFDAFEGKFNKIDGILKVFSDRFDKIDADLADIKRAISPILQMMAVQDRDLESIKFRLDRLEHQAGLLNN